jgi:hypothetical protein
MTWVIFFLGFASGCAITVTIAVAATYYTLRNRK